MVTFNPLETVIAGTGTIYHAPEDTPLPAHLTETLDAEFLAVGYTTEDGAKFTDSKTVNHVRVWQSFYPIRSHVTEKSGTVEFSMVQWNESNMILAYGGGGIIEPVAGEYRYEPPSPETLAVRACVIDFVDGDKHYRFTAGRVFVTSNVESTWAKSGPAMLPITLEVLAPAEGDNPWTIDSDDPAFEPVAS